ncbi:MAG: site-specific DNA-methyltransferase [Armatimonadetes bacterium]|nr:site-specific DNA-methyltransferase [Armatimonadota bacterium]
MSGTIESSVDSRNSLNELTNTEWMIETKSVWFSRPPQRDKLKAQHPATFAESDIVRLIDFFTKPGGHVLDPFVGSGSTLVACAQCGRQGTGIELVDYWADVARKRSSAENPALEQAVLTGDAREVMSELDDSAFDFIVTSPPYWMILRKDWDHKVKAERKSKGLNTRYSDEINDLGNLESYDDFLAELGRVFGECRRVLKKKSYMCVVVSDFRHKSRFVAYHADISRVMESVGFTLEGITVLVQDNKNLYPYGLPFAFVSNIHHQYILVFRNNGNAGHFEL